MVTASRLKKKKNIVIFKIDYNHNAFECYLELHLSFDSYLAPELYP